MTAKLSIDRTAHVDPESLGVYLEGRATAAERADIQAHLATCPDCYAVFADSAEALSDEPHQPQAAQAEDIVSPVRDSLPLPAPRRRLPPWWMAGFAVAAVAILIGWIGITRLRPSVRDTPEFEALIAAMRAGRPVEGRLAGGLPYGPPPSPVRSAERGAAQSPRLEAAAALVESKLQADRRPAAQHARGVALLVANQVAEAIGAFEAAAAGDPENAAIRNDLAAAYLQRGIAGPTGSPTADFERALAEADRAQRLSPNMSEAVFNRAMILERLGRPEEARTIWVTYLTIDPSSDWATEARARASSR